MVRVLSHKARPVGECFMRVRVPYKPQYFWAVCNLTPKFCHIQSGPGVGPGQVKAGSFPKTNFLAISDHSEHFSKTGSGEPGVGPGGFFQKPIFSPFQIILNIFQKTGSGGPGVGPGGFFQKPVFSPFQIILNIFQKTGSGGPGAGPGWSRRVLLYCFIQNISQILKNQDLGDENIWGKTFTWILIHVN